MMSAVKMATLPVQRGVNRAVYDFRLCSEPHFMIMSASQERKENSNLHAEHQVSDWGI